jgi:hypothetical protein
MIKAIISNNILIAMLGWATPIDNTSLSNFKQCKGKIDTNDILKSYVVLFYSKVTFMVISRTDDMVLA